MLKNIMLTKRNILLFVLILFGCSSQQKEPIVIFLIGDSTMANYAKNSDYSKTRYPMTGWGQVFQECFTGTDLTEFKNLFDADSVIVDDRAIGGRSTRTFFQQGRWRNVYQSLKKGDIVIMQFGHNDAAENKTERYVNVDGYKEFLRLFVSETKEKYATPIILTPVCNNYPWEESHLENSHGDYPQAALDVAEEMDTYFIDLNQLSMETFSKKGQEYVTSSYFMNLPEGKYEAYPEGLTDNTHFQPEGAKAVANLVFKAMKTLN